MTKRKFDKFTLRQYQEGWMIEAGIMRPNNAPRYRHTEADRKRRVAESKLNYEDGLYKQTFPTLDDAVAKIRELCYEEELAA